MERNYAENYNLFKDLIFSYVKTNNADDFLKIQEVFEENENLKSTIIINMPKYPCFIKAFKISEQIDIINDLFEKMIGSASVTPDVVINVLENVSDNVLDVVLKNADNVVLVKLVDRIVEILLNLEEMEKRIKNLMYDVWSLARLINLKKKIKKNYK